MVTVARHHAGDPRRAGGGATSASFFGGEHAVRVAPGGGTSPVSCAIPIHRPLVALLFGALVALASRPASACGDDGEGFEAWLAQTRRDAVAAGISEKTVKLALAGVFYDEEVIRLDRSQKPFKKTFRQFAAKRITKALVREGVEMLEAHRKTLAALEQKHGVPPAIVVALWGLETSYGADVGERSVFRSLATLAWDCRRSERFQGELMSALRIAERGDLQPHEMRGAWAGELGQTQFLPSSYERFAVDFDGDGRADLIHSIPDVLASTAGYLAGHGWRRDEGWKEGTENFKVLAAWNKSAVVQKTIALFATRLVKGR